MRLFFPDRVKKFVVYFGRVFFAFLEKAKLLLVIVRKFIFSYVDI